jgi:RNA polymerase sigma factor (sigma-70 family)
LADAEDLAQEVFLRLARAWHAMQIEARDGATLRALLAVMTRRLAVDWMRRGRRLRRDVRKEASVQSVADPAVESPAMAEVDWADLMHTVARRLADDERSVLDLRIQGYEVLQIASRLGLASRTVERKLARVRQVLRPYLEMNG